ncbi:MAG TPA: S41 family peptidase [Candidatus Limnocylindrales bacterium]|nr:S41 family peptidase [Candidatus Limnocylindrales bacterium]
MDLAPERHAENRVEERPCTRLAWPVTAAVICGLSLGWLAAMGCASSHKYEDFQLVSQAWSTIQAHYVDRAEVQPKELTYGAISGMVDALGDTGHSTFLTPEMVRELKNLERGELKGIGIEVQMKNGQVVIVAPIDGSPAQRAGLRPGEIILKVGGDDIADWPLSKVVEKILGPAGTKVSLTVQDPRTNQTRQVTMARVSIKLHEVTWHRLPGTDIVHVRIATFDAGVTKDLHKALQELQRDGVKGIVLDLRNDPGGLLEEAIGVASQFIQSGAVVLTKDAKGEITKILVEPGGQAIELPMAVLVNQGSASAAEIVAGALRDSDRAPLIGETTFGTGTVLQQFGLSDGSALLLAVGEWLTPKGESFWHKGITPQFQVTLPTDISPLVPSGEEGMTHQQLMASDDRQLLTALRLLDHPEQWTHVTPSRRKE